MLINGETIVQMDASLAEGECLHKSRKGTHAPREKFDQKVKTTDELRAQFFTGSWGPKLSRGIS